MPSYHYRTAVCLFYPLDNSYMSREQDVGKSICHLWVYGQEKHYREIKKVEYLSLWQISQMGEDVTIDLIDHE